MFSNFAHQYSQKYLSDLQNILRLPKVVAIGTIGLDLVRSADTLQQQTYTMNQFLKLAKTTEKVVKIHTRGGHSEVMAALNEHLKDDHKIIYTNFDMKCNEALEFLLKYPHGFIGFSNRQVNPRSDGYEVVEKVLIKRLVLGSYSFFGGTNRISSNIDLEQLVFKIANIKHQPFHDIARQLRRNINTLFCF